jgi:hypothetical protein
MRRRERGLRAAKLRPVEQQSSWRVLFRLETQQERSMPYLFWAVLPFALMDTWWGMCEQRRDTD